MLKSYDFMKSVLDTITEHIVVIDKEGCIVFVNKTWSSFGDDNDCSINNDWVGVNYLQECDKSNDDDNFGIKAASGIRSVITGKKDAFYFEYPCHSLDEQRWFIMRATPFTIQEDHFFVISHQNITERKLAEEEALNLSRIDSLTGIANRRYFNEFLNNEWQRCYQLGEPVSLAIIDLDHFKLVNDTYGHQIGDEYLILVGKTLKAFSRRTNDLCARYGGEEFVIVYGGTHIDQAKILVEQLLNEIRALKIPNKLSPILPTLTVSIGLTSMQPNTENNMTLLINKSDELLYSAKKNGKNKMIAV